MAIFLYFMDHNLAILILMFGAFIYFWFMSFDAKLVVEVQLETGPPEPTMAIVPKFFSGIGFGAAIWSVVLGYLASDSHAKCKLAIEDIISLNTILAVITVVVSGKVIFGPMMSKRQSFLLMPNGEVTRPLLFRLRDAAIGFPQRIVDKISLKVAAATIFATAIWFFSPSSLSAKTSSIVQLPLFIAWFMFTLARTAQLKISVQMGLAHILKQQPFVGLTPYHYRVLHSLQWITKIKYILGIAIIVSTLLTYLLVEAALRNCGATQNSFPSLFACLGILGRILIKG